MSRCLNKSLWLLLFLLWGWAIISAAQPCLPGWKYSTPIYVSNSLGQAVNGQPIEVTFHSQQLINAGKLSITGADLRIVDNNGAALPFWIDPISYNSGSSKIWVKHSIAASTTDTIYLFYGASGVNSMSNGNAVFPLFEDFSGTINPSRWSTCGAGTVSTASGSAQFSVTNAGDKVALSSVQTFTSPIAVEMGVLHVTKGSAFIGAANVGATDNGYATVFEEISPGIQKMRVNKITTNTPCFNLTVLNAPDNTGHSIGSGNGTWGMRWYATGKQGFYWPGGADTAIDGTVALPAQASIVLGLMDKAGGSATIDWVTARPSLAQEPSIQLGTEVSYASAVMASAKSTNLCIQDTLKLTASVISGASYSWTGPNGFTSSVREPSIVVTSNAQAGVYTVSASIGGNCASVTDQVLISVSTPSVAGVLSSDDTICSGNNSGALRSTARTGAVIRWESSVSGNKPWSTISSTDDTLAYTNLTQTNFYRVVVKNGACEADYSSPVKLTVDAATVAGSLSGPTNVCVGSNQGTVQLSQQTGRVLAWEYSTDNGATWTPQALSTTQYGFTNLLDTTLYRVQVKSGVCQALFSDTISIRTIPSPAVRFSKHNACIGETVQLSDSTTSGNGVQSVSWNFGNGTGSTIQHPQVVYNAPGKYVVQLEATSTAGCKGAGTDTVYIHPRPVPAFTVGDVCEGDSSKFVNNSTVSSGSIAQYRWTFGDNTPVASGSAATHLYASSGAYQAQLVAISDSGCADSVVVPASVHVLPQASFTADTVTQGDRTQFTNRSTISSGSLIYYWSFGDGNNANNVKDPSHGYVAAGAFEVGLIAVSNHGCGDTLRDSVRVFSAPIADFAVSGNCLNDTTVIQNMSSSVLPLTYHWAFGDGTFSADSFPKHRYLQPGVYTIELTVTDPYGGMKRKTKSVEIAPLPLLNLSHINACDGTPLLFKSNATISSGSLSYLWNFGDSDTSTSKDPNHVYASAGMYTAQCVVTSDRQCKDSASLQVEVYPEPVVQFSADTVCFGLQTSFTNNTTLASGNVVQYSWNLGDGSNSIDLHPKNVYDIDGTFNVTQTATSNKGCTASLTKAVSVLPIPNVQFEFSNVCDGEPVVFRNQTAVSQGAILSEWGFGDGASANTLEAVHLYSSAGKYTVSLKASTPSGCVDSLKREVVIYELPAPFILAEHDSISKGASTNLFGYGGQLYTWTPTSSLNSQNARSVIATPKETTSYGLMVVDSNGCEGVATKSIHVKNDFVLVPANIITPDNNGQNDTWVVQNIDSYSQSRVVIADRWGKVVFESEDYKNDWAGVNQKGEPLTDGTYYYILTNSASERVYKGAITLLRNN